MTALKRKPTFNEEKAIKSIMNCRVLVVDDELDLAKSYVDILHPEDLNAKKIQSSRRSSVTQINHSEFQFEIDVVNNAEQALIKIKEAIAKGQPYAMGFFDVMLGEGLDGINLVKEVFKLDNQIYIVFVTAYQDRSVDSIKNLLGENTLERWDYLNKPFNSGEILQKARNLCSLWNLKLRESEREVQMEELRRRVSASERLSSVAAISRGVSHEFGNILMQIMGKADISRRKKPEDMQRALEIIVDASQRASKILEKFKGLSNTGQSQNPKEKLFIHDVLDKSIELMEFQLRESNVKISRIKTDKVCIPMNSTSIMQVLVNLTINSIHAMGDSGQIDYTITEVTDFAELRVRDYGPGLKNDLIEKVLEPFFTTKGSGGSGLGLSICKEIVEIEHGGEFTLKNHGIKGLEVIIKLPIICPLEEDNEP